jgi:hypothetical protein
MTKPKMPTSNTDGKGERPTKRGGRPCYKPNDEEKATVTSLAAARLPREHIALLLGMDVKTLSKHFQPELKKGQYMMLAKGISNIWSALNSSNEHLRFDAGKFTVSRLGKEFGWTEKLDAPQVKDYWQGVDLSRLDDAEFRAFAELLAKAGLRLEVVGLADFDSAAEEKKRLIEIEANRKKKKS